MCNTDFVFKEEINIMANEIWQSEDDFLIKDDHKMKGISGFQILKVLIGIRYNEFKTEQEIIQFYANMIKKYENNKKWELMNMVLEELILDIV